ncbi:MAG TPA: hypothetical protein VK427_06800 [Kofleriaceae bacterium]|nr:hypothetical protein [Kofleriaceae bacterium]
MTGTGKLTTIAAAFVLGVVAGQLKPVKNRTTTATTTIATVVRVQVPESLRAGVQSSGNGDSPVAASGSSCSRKAFPPGHTLERDNSAYTAARAYETTRGQMDEVFANELRNADWASEREHQIASYTRRDILAVDPNAKMDVECKSSSCRIRIGSESRYLTDVMGDYPFACMARYGTAELTQGEPGSRYAVFYILFGSENQDNQKFLANRERTCPKYRDKWLAFVSEPFSP